MPSRDDHELFRGFRKELAWGLLDGRLIGIAEARNGAACGCVCPVCGVPLIARHGEKLAHHFAHAGGGEGCGAGAETNAHLWAKEELGKALRIHLPPVAAEAAGLSKTVHRGGPFSFAKAELEKHSGDIVPDVLLTAADGRRLIVEVYVTHKCGPEKIERIRAGGVSAIEVDMRHWRLSQDAAEIADALLHAAPRKWIYNPTQDEARAALEDEARQLAKAAAERKARQAREEVARVRRASVKKPPELERLRTTLQALGHGSLLVGAKPEDGFVVPARLWKAAALGRLIRDMPAAGRGPQVTADLLIGLVPDCLYRDGRYVRPRIDLAALKAAVPGYRTAYEVMEEFVQTLHDANILYYQKGDLWLSPEVVTRARAMSEARKKEKAAVEARTRRSNAAREKIDRLFERANLPQESRVFSFAAWAQDIRSAPGRSLASLIDTGDEEWDRLVVRLDAIGGMLNGGAPVDDLLGLPFEAQLAEARAQAQWIAEQEAAAEQASLATERRTRRAAIRTEAGLKLGLDADPWLAAASGYSGGSRLEAAMASDHDLARIRSDLASHAWAVEQDRRRAVVAEGFKSKLKHLADSAYDEAHAAFFLGSRRKELGWKTPLDHCVDERSLAECQRLLPRRRG